MTQAFDLRLTMGDTWCNVMWKRASRRVGTHWKANGDVHLGGGPAQSHQRGLRTLEWQLVLCNCIVQDYQGNPFGGVQMLGLWCKSGETWQPGPERPVIVEFYYSRADKKTTLEQHAIGAVGGDTLQAFNDTEFSGSPQCHCGTNRLECEIHTCCQTTISWHVTLCP